MNGLVEATEKVWEVPVADVFCDNDFNCRGYIIPADVLDLVRDIQIRGQEQPIVIQPWNKQPGKKWRIVAGHRRYTAFVVMKRETIRAFVRDNLSELQARIINLTENLKRKDLNLLQISNAIRPFVAAGWTQEEIAKQLEQPKHWVQVCTTLLRLPEQIQNEAAAGYLTQEHIKQLGQLNKKPNNTVAMFEAVKKIKNSKQLGEKKKIDVKKKVTKPFSKAVRTRQEMFDLMAKIQDTVGNSFVTRVLGWASGEVPHIDIHRDLKAFCKEEYGIDYEIPAELVQAAHGMKVA
jgi:ParB/RepB/Spo0J family partition protein